ncbi:PKD domain-containing protein [Patulibacter americanus]|uniref:PKD domain-containing protein n=1 Tax=Patulibacter americanus TaxID=588672 RepID=UPI00040A1355|nr:PKD domain-containing protein [Patulibacter americanus]
MSPTRPSSPPVPGRRARPAALLAASVLGGFALAAAPAGAAWTPPAALGFEPEALWTGVPGQAAFAGVDDLGTTQLALRSPGSSTLRPAPSPVPPEEYAVYGAGGAVAFIVPEPTPTLQVGTIDAGGVFTLAGSIDVDGDDSLEAVAAAGDGSVAVVYGDGDSALHLVLARAGTTPNDQIVSADGTVASPADVAPASGGGYAAAWLETNDTTTEIAGLRVRPGAAPDPRVTLVIDDDISPDALIEEIAVPPGAAVPTAVWGGTAPDANGVTTTYAWLSVQGTATREVASLPGEGSAVVETRAFPSGRILVAATLVTEDGDGFPVVKVLPPTAGPECVVPGRALDPRSTPTAGAITLVGLDAARAIVRHDVREDCGGEPPVTGPRAPGAVKAVGTDPQGSLVVAVSDEENAAGAFTVDDRTPPTLSGLRAPSRLAPGERFSASVQASDAWSIGTVSWRLDGRPFGEDGTTVNGRAPEAGEHRLEVTATDAAGNRSRATTTVTVVADDAGAPTPPPGPGAEVPLPEPKPGGKQPRSPSDPTVRIRSIQETSKGWVLRLRVRHASRVRLRLYRERYLGAEKLRRPLTCPVRPRPLRRPPTGLRGRTTVVVDGASVALRIPRPLADALRKRGRYTLSVVALGTGSKARTASAAANRSFTAC